MKDPAFLFYTSDFLTGTMFMTNEQIGIYIRLLCSQHQHGGIIDKVTFNAMVSTHDIIRSKFIECETGYYNERLMQEMDKRSKKSTNISNAVKDIWIKRKNGIALNNDGIPLELQKDSKRKPKKKRAILMRPENVNEVVNYFIENGYSKNAATRAFNYYEVNDWHDKNGEPVLNWKMKMQSVWFKDENKDTTEKPIEQMSIEEIREMKNKQFRL